MVRPPTHDRVVGLAQVLAREAPGGVAAAYAFGSHAEGRAHRESDVDIGVLLLREHFATARTRFDEGVRLASWLAAELHHPAIDLVVLNDAPPGLAARVVTGGTRVYVGDAEIEHAFRRDAQLRAADIAPFLRRARALKLQALVR